jgi:hypothetical protein
VTGFVLFLLVLAAAAYVAIRRAFSRSPLEYVAPVGVLARARHAATVSGRLASLAAGAWLGVMASHVTGGWPL